MKYSKEDALEFVREEDVKFIRLAFCDVFGRLKNIAIMPSELPRAFEYGISFDASSIAGFGDEARSDLLLHPEPETLVQLPWRPEHGGVVRMFCDVSYPDGRAYENDARFLLKKAIEEARRMGRQFFFGSELEFYLFELDERDAPTKIPYDSAGYMDVYPEDKGENIRREICLTLEQMGVRPECSHHEQGPGQNEIDFRFSDALTAADDAVSFKSVVRTVARRNGLYADFSAKPLEDAPGNGFHINMSLDPAATESEFNQMIAGALARVTEATLFFNPTENSYKRLGRNKAPRYVSWSRENRSQTIRIPAAYGEFRRAELRSPDPSANPYLAFALLIYAGLEGLDRKLALPEPADFNLYKADADALSDYRKLPEDLSYAKKVAQASEFIQRRVPGAILDLYCNR